MSIITASFFLNESSSTDIYTYCHTLSLPDALPIYDDRISQIWRQPLLYADRSVERAHQPARPPRSVRIVDRRRDRDAGLSGSRAADPPRRNDARTRLGRTLPDRRAAAIGEA